MKAIIAAVALLGAAIVGASASAQDTRSVWTGVYTRAQARRGAAIYREVCASCHGLELEGGEMAPPLAGPAFMANWNTLTMGDLFERIRITMPESQPGKLSRQQNVDVLAYLLNAGRFPAGKTELPRETENLKQIRFEANRP